MGYTYEISKDLDVSYQDQGPWRSFFLEAYGNDKESFVDNSFIYEIDQDGGELGCYHILEASKEVLEAARKEIGKLFVLDEFNKNWRYM